MKRSLSRRAVLAAAFLAANAGADTVPAARQKIASLQYLVGTWNCVHTVGTFSGTYTTAWAKVLGELWLRQTYDFPPRQFGESEAPVHAESWSDMTRGGRAGCGLAPSARASTSPSE